LNIAFTMPRMAVLGKSYREASQGAIAIGESSYENQGRARVIAQAHGHVRVYVDRASQQLLGAEMFGPGVEHTAHLLAWAVQAHLPLAELLRMPVYHPTLEEGIRTALRDAAKKLELLKRCPPTDLGTSAGT
jgi:dihydrolipoamide dehydrogenase